jgi:formamidopyrimidine-DNA glycosylase
MTDPDQRELVLLVHLGMSGRCGIASAEQERVLHTHLVLDFDDGRQLRFVDPRRFGGLRAGLAETIYAAEPIASLGPEPLERGFDGELLARALGRSDRALRDALLDQRAVAGIGNIYALEACFEAGLHPLARSRSSPASASAPPMRLARRSLTSSHGWKSTKLRTTNNSRNSSA